MSQPPNTRSSSEASGTNSAIRGERLSVRLPRRTVPICVRLPIGRESPRRTASTPATNVVARAHEPLLAEVIVEDARARQVLLGLERVEHQDPAVAGEAIVEKAEREVAHAQRMPLSDVFGPANCSRCEWPPL